MPKGGANVIKRSTYSNWSREALLERVRQLEDLLGFAEGIHPSFGLTSGEALLFNLLTSHAPEVLRRESALLAIWGPDRVETDARVVEVMILRIRNKLWPFGIEITTQWNVGWFVSAGEARLADLRSPRGSWPWPIREGTRPRLRPEMPGKGRKPGGFDASRGGRA